MKLLFARAAAAALLAASTTGIAGSRVSDRVVELRVPDRSSSTPWIAAEGGFVAVAWGAGDASGTDVFVATSRDGGTTFAPPVRVNSRAGEARLGGEMPPRVAVKRRAAGTDPEVVVLWTAKGESTEIKLARSTDAGRTFSRPQSLQSLGAAGDRGWTALALDKNGAAHAIWLDHRGLATAGAASGHHTHAGQGSSSTKGTTDGVAMAQRSGLYYGSSEAGGGDRELTKGVCYCCKTALAAGPDGSLFAAWRHVYAGNIRDIAFMQSADGGRTFSSPARISEDRWELDGCPDDGPAMVVDGTKTVHIVWPTVIGKAKPEGALFYSSTRDGRTFTQRVRIPTLGGPKPSHPQVALDAGGRLFVSWDEIWAGTRQAAVRTITIGEGGGATFGPIMKLGAGAPATYPVLAASADGLLAAWTRGAGASSTILVGRIEPGHLLNSN